MASFLKGIFGGSKARTKASAIPSAWVLANWNQPDLSCVVDFVRKNCKEWAYYVPQFSLVPCASERKPAIFLKVGLDYDKWTRTVELRGANWTAVSTGKYIGLGWTALFENPTGEVIGISGEKGEVHFASIETQHRLACSNVLDPASPEVDEWFNSWTRMAGVIMLFFVQHDLTNINYMNFAPSERGFNNPATKSLAIESLEKAKAKLRELDAIGNFNEEREALRRQLPHRVHWENP